MTRCSICKLEPSKRGAVDAALRGQVPLEELSRTSGLSKSTLHRHGQHLARPIEATVPEVVQPATVKRRIEAPAPLEAQTLPAAPSIPAPTKSQLLERIELLWNEGLDGLAASKEPIRLNKPDGSTLELPGDLRARAGFLRELRGTVELAGMATGEFQQGQSQGNTFYVMAGSINIGSALDAPVKVIDVKPADSD